MGQNLSYFNAYVEKMQLFLRIFSTLRPFINLAGVEGFEPSSAGVRVQCLNHLATPLSVIVFTLGRGSRI